MSEPPRLPKFGRLPCFYQHLWCVVDTSGFEPNLLIAKQVILPFDLTTRARNTWDSNPSFAVTGRYYYHYTTYSICVPTRSRTLTFGLEDPRAFHYTIRTCGNGRTRTYCLRLNRPQLLPYELHSLVAGSGLEPLMNTAYETAL